MTIHTIFAKRATALQRHKSLWHGGTCCFLLVLWCSSTCFPYNAGLPSTMTSFFVVALSMRHPIHNARSWHPLHHHHHHQQQQRQSSLWHLNSGTAFTVRPHYGSSSALYQSPMHASDSSNSNNEMDDIVDVAIVGAGIGGLCAGAVLNTLYQRSVGVYEAHVHAGGCAHAYPRRIRLLDNTAHTNNNNNNNTGPHTIYNNNDDGDNQNTTVSSSWKTIMMDSGPTILLGCSRPPYNALQQVLIAIGQDQHVTWIPYDGWYELFFMILLNI
jgi:hypothetical protein